MRKIFTITGCLCILVLFFSIIASYGGETAARNSAENGIPQRMIVELRKELAATMAVSSTMRRRRALKHVARDSLSAVDEYPAAANRFRLLGVVFDARKELLVLHNDARNRRALLETSRKLRDAPDEYAADRLEADILLMRLENDRQGATEHERILSIADLADRYRDTPAEVDSLIAASEMAFNLGAARLLGALRYTLAHKFTENVKAIGFLKDRFASKSSSLMFRGRFEREDGETLVLPIDRAGHVYLACFWSSQLYDLKERFMPIKELQHKYPGRFEVLSFNLDELPDAGKSILDGFGLDWTPLHLPGGSTNQLFRACGSDPQFLIRITNANGYVILTPIGSTYRTYGRVRDLEEYLNITLDTARFLALTQAIRIGDFLVLDPSRSLDNNLPAGWEKNAVPASRFRAIQACFTAPPMRYRLSKEEAIRNYEKAATLCAETIAQYPDSELIWFVYNRRIIALLGLWNLNGEPNYLRQAAEAAATALTKEIPPAAQIVPRFCLAKAALRENDADAEAVLARFMKASNSDKPSGLTLGAAVTLSLDAGSPVLFEKFRERLLNEHMDKSQLWPLTAYLFNRFVVGRLFRGNHYSRDVRVYVGFRSWQKNTEVRPRKFKMKLADLTGKVLEFPHSDKDKSNVVVFMEPPADEASAKVQVDFVDSLETLAKAHAHKNINFLVAFVSEDTEAIKALVQKNGWDPDRIALVPDGLKNPHVVRLGIFLADQRPNTFMVAHDGTVIWSMSGMYQMAVSTTGVTGTVREKVQEHDLATGRRALQESNYQKAVKIFRDAMPDYRGKPHSLKAAQRIGLARAYKGLKKWPAALKGYNAMVNEHIEAAIRRPCACYSLARKLQARAEILTKLGREKAAAADRQRAELLACPHEGSRKFNPTRYEQALFNRLQKFQSRQDWQAAFDYINDIIVYGRDGRQAERDELAGVLRERAQVLTQLGQEEKAQQDRQWAVALTAGIEINEAHDAQSRNNRRPQRYVDLVK